jgi:DNA topoisomerase-1
VKVGRFGPYVQLGAAQEDEKPRMKSLLPGMTPDTLTLEDAVRLLSLPRSLGTDEETKKEVFADFGRFGPYVKRGDDSRSLAKTDDVFGVTLERALELLRQEKKGGWRSRGPSVIREVGAHPDSKAAIQLLSGRYGPYVTDGTTNASLARGGDPDKLTLEEALGLLRARAAAGPAKRSFQKTPRAARRPTATAAGAVKTRAAGAVKTRAAAKGGRKTARGK